MTGHQTSEPLRAVLHGPVEASGLDLEAVEISSAGRRRVVRVLVDKDGGVGLDDLADATRVVGDALDASDALGDTPYTLEVTSPGVDRPLTLPRHWRRNAGRLVDVVDHEGQRRTGRIVQADDEAVTLDVSGEAQHLAYAEVVTARIEIEFGKPAGPDGGRAGHDARIKARNKARTEAREKTRAAGATGSSGADSQPEKED
jgi:ribosome maturation factor RimP